MEDAFVINVGITIKGITYRIAYLSHRYRHISNTLCWRNGWQKLTGRVYVNKIILEAKENKQ